MSLSTAVWKRVLLPCAALIVLTSGCATTAAPPAKAPSAGPAAGTAKPHLLTRAEQLKLARAGKPSNGPLPAPTDGPPPVVYDIGEHCLRYRYSEASHCADDVPQEDCDAAQKGDCGIKLPFVLTNWWCARAPAESDEQLKARELQEWHVYCQGYVPTGPPPQPQCPDGHVLGDAGSDCVSSCTTRCDLMCPGGYCVGGAYNLCYLGYEAQCDCGTAFCPCTGPNC